MGPAVFAISFGSTPDLQQSQSPVVYPGQFLTGHVILHLMQPQRARSLKLRFRGFEYTCIRETQNNGKESHTVTYTQTREIFKLEKIMWGYAADGTLVNVAPQDKPQTMLNEQQPQGFFTSLARGIFGEDRALTMPAGYYIIPFQFQIPMFSGMPSSFEGGAYGHIRYQVRAIVDLPWRLDFVCERPFTLIEPILVPSQQLENKVNVQKTMGMCCFAAGTVDIEIFVPRPTVCPAEIVSVFLNVNNNSKKNVTGCTLILERHAKFTAQSRNRSVSTKLDSIRQNFEIPAMSGHSSTIQMQISLPSNCGPTINGQIIQVRHALIVHVHYEGAFTWKSKIDIQPFTVGTIPQTVLPPQYLMYTNTQQPPGFVQVNNYLPDSVAIGSSSTGYLNGYEQEPLLLTSDPPKFTEVQGDQELEHNYIPVYEPYNE